MSRTNPITIRDNIDLEKIYLSNNCGPYKIIENLGYSKDNNNKQRYYVTVQFLETGTIKTVRLSDAESGNIHDKMYCLNLGKVFYHIYYGPYIILSDEGTKDNKYRMVKIRFLNTGYESIVTSAQANSVKVSDQSILKSEIKSTYGTFDYMEYDRQIKEILKCKWHGMMRRCYDKTYSEYFRYGAQGITVTTIWQYLDGFLATIENVQNYNAFYVNPAHYQLDKDYLQKDLPKNQRQYGPLTCIFLTEYENSILARLDNHIQGTYFGVTSLGNNYFKAEFTICNNKINVGIFDDLSAALTAYEYYYAVYSSYYIPHPMHYDINASNIYNRTMPKDYKYMSIEEAMKHKVK